MSVTYLKKQACKLIKHQGNNDRGDDVETNRGKNKENQVICMTVAAMTMVAITMIAKIGINA